MEQRRQLPALTGREAEVLRLIASGLSSREAASHLHVSSKDIDYHVGHLFQKLGCHNRSGLIGRACAFGYLVAGEWPPISVRIPAESHNVEKTRKTTSDRSVGGP
jgi:DNA-binding CsgD family transcriptional regulator